MKRHLVVLAVAALTPALALAGSRAAKGGPAITPIRPPARIIGQVEVTGLGVMHVSPEVVRLTLSYEQKGDPQATVAQLLHILQEDVQAGKATINEIVGQAGEVTVEPPTWSERSDHANPRLNFAGWSVVQNVAVSLQIRDAKVLQDRLAALYDQDKTLATRPSPAVWDVLPETRASAQDQAARLAVDDAKRKAEARLSPGYSLGEVTHISDGSGKGINAHPAGLESLAARSHGDAEFQGPLIQAGKIAILAVATYTFQLLLRPFRLIPSPDTHPARRGGRGDKPAETDGGVSQPT